MRTASRLLASLAAVALVPAALAQFVQPTDWPVERLVANLSRQVEARPSDGAAHYSLGRVHAWAYAFATGEVALFHAPPEAIPAEEPLDAEMLAATLPPDALQRQRFSGAERESEELAAAARLAHLEPAIRHLSRACELLPRNAETHLSLANVLEAGAGSALEVDSPALLGWKHAANDDERARLAPVLAALASPDAKVADSAERELADPDLDRLARALPVLWEQRETPDERLRARIASLLARAWLQRAAQSYRRAYELARGDDAGLEQQPIDDPWHASPLDSLASYEAGQALLRLAREKGIGERKPDLLVGIETHMRSLEKKPKADAITPIVLALEPGRALADLVAERLAVPFDLDGDCVVEEWPWLAPGAGWLVWDPARRGEITSGRQMFGSASGWLFFADGYRVLAALDDDASGALEGAELAGIAVWFDRDVDGVSDAGEVAPVEALGIVALATEATERVGASLANPCGLELADGRVLPTYDWVLRPTGAP